MLASFYVNNGDPHLRSVRRKAEMSGLLPGLFLAVAVWMGDQPATTTLHPMEAPPPAVLAEGYSRFYDEPCTSRLLSPRQQKRCKAGGTGDWFGLVALNRTMPLLWKYDGFAAVKDCKKVDTYNPWLVSYQLCLRDCEYKDRRRWVWGRVRVNQVVDCMNPLHYHAPGKVIEVDRATATLYPRMMQIGKTQARIVGWSRAYQRTTK